MTTRETAARQDGTHFNTTGTDRQNNQMQAGQRSPAVGNDGERRANATGMAGGQMQDEAGDYYHHPRELRDVHQQHGWRDSGGNARSQAPQARQFGGGQQGGSGGEFGGPQRGGYGGGSAGGSHSIYGGYPGRDNPPSTAYGGDMQRERQGQDAYAARGTNDAYAPMGSWGSSQDPRQDPHHHDPEYRQWRDAQMRKLDDEYRQWREERYQKFSTEFDEWRRNRMSQLPGGHAPTASVAGEEDPGAALVGKPAKP